MPSITSQSPMRDNPNGAPIGLTAFIGSEVEVLETQGEWTKIRVRSNQREGWVRSNTIGDAPATRGVQFDEETFADICVLQGQAQGAVPHYMLAVAKLRSGLQDGQGGPFRLTPEQWAANCKDPQFEIDFPPAMQSWDCHPAVFAIMARRAEQALNPTGENPRPTALALYQQQFPGEPVAPADLDRAFADTAALAIAAHDKVAGPAEEDVPSDQFGETPSGGGISQRAYDLILEFEVSSKEVYERKYRRPIWPAVKSGVTIGIGYDVGYATRDQLRSDWDTLIPAQMIAALEGAVGVKGQAAKALAEQLRPAVDVPWEAAIQVHSRTVIPRWIAAVQKQLSNTQQLSLDSFGALVSLAYNRGAGGFASDQPRFTEMRAIRRHMQNRDFARIPEAIIGMKRLWPDVPGLLRRRDREARLFREGLAQPPAGNQPAGAQAAANAQANVAAPDRAAVVDRLRRQIAAGKITFQDPVFESELLATNAGTRVTAKLQFLILKLSELASPIQISSVIRTGDAGHHGTGRAVDIGNEEIASILLPQVAKQDMVDALQIDEIIFDASRIGAVDSQKWNFDQGRPHKFNEATMRQHRNHIHFAVKA